MKTLSLNLLKYNPLNDEPLEVSEFTFWKYYLELLQVKAGSFLVDNEVTLLAHVFSGDVNKSYFKSPLSQDIMEKMGISTVYFHKLKKSLVDKGVIYSTDIRGDFLLNKRLVQFQKDMKAHFEAGYDIEFKFKFRKNEDKD